jgi:hypothetical protein
MPISLADPTAGEDLAAQNIAIGAPSSFADNFRASWNASRLNDRFIGSTTALEEQYDGFNDKVFKQSGTRLPNPIRGEVPDGVNRVDFTGDPRIPLPVEKAIDLWQDFATKRGYGPPKAAEFQDRANAAMRGAETARADVASRGVGASAGFGQFLGSAAAIATDPPVLASMLFGGGEAATVLRTMGREALVAGLTETAVQPQIQIGRVQAGLPGGFEQGAENVAMAAGGAGLLSGVFRGAAAAYRGLRARTLKIAPSTTEAADAARYVERYADLQGANPLAETAQGAAEHVDRLSAAQSRLYDPGVDAAATAIPDAPLSAVRHAAELEPPPVRERLDEPLPQRAASLGEQLATAARKSEDGLDAFKRAQQTATEVENLLDDETLNMARKAAPTPPRDDPSLVQAIIARGGVSDSDGALASVGVTPRQRPGLVSRSGISASDMSELMHELGYFRPAGAGEGSRVVDQRELAQHIADELGGQKLFARHGPGGNPEARADYEHALQTHADINRALDELGIDGRRMSNDEIRDAVQSIKQAPSPELPSRIDHTQAAIERARRADADLDYSVEHEERIAMAAENSLREQFLGRPDEPIWVEIGGEMRAIPAREVFQGLEDDARLVDEFKNCMGVPF